jgi:hypothetical protein
VGILVPVRQQVREPPYAPKATLALLDICAWAYALIATVHAIA